MKDNKIVLRIAQKIRLTRLEKGMTMQQVAEQSNVSKGLISRIENGRTIPSLPVFVDILLALGASFKSFFEDMSLDEGRNYILVRANDHTNVDREGRKGFEYRHILSHNLRSGTMQVVLLTLQPGAKSVPAVTDGFELKYMLAGECRYIIDDEVVDLRTGDTLYFDASLPHVPVNSTQQTAVMLVLYFLQDKH